MQNNVSVSFNQEELNTLASLLDIAVKAAGIQAAKAAVPLFEKIEKSVAEFNSANAPVETKEAA